MTCSFTRTGGDSTRRGVFASFGDTLSSSWRRGVLANFGEKSLSISSAYDSNGIGDARCDIGLDSSLFDDDGFEIDFDFVGARPEYSDFDFRDLPT